MFKLFFKGQECPQHIERTENIILRFSSFVLAWKRRGMWHLYSPFGWCIIKGEKLNKELPGSISGAPTILVGSLWSNVWSYHG